MKNFIHIIFFIFPTFLFLSCNQLLVGNNNSYYTIQYYQQNINDDNYNLYDSKQESGITNEMTNVSAIDIPGFNLLNIEQKKIEKDGSTTIKVYYERKEITLLFLLSDDDSDIYIRKTGKYGSLVGDIDDPVKDRCTFLKWSKDVPVLYPVTDEIIIALWNEDKAPPAQVSNLQTLYNGNDNQIEITWIDPSDIDFEKVQIHYDDSDYYILKGVEKHIIQNVLPDGTSKLIQIFTLDYNGNKSEVKQVSVVAEKKILIKSLILDRNHFSSTDCGTNVNLCIEGYCLDLINKNTEDNTFKVQILDSENVIIQTLSVNGYSNNKAEIQIEIPQVDIYSLTSEGKTYKVRLKICGEIINYISTTFRISKGPELQSLEIVNGVVKRNEINSLSNCELYFTGNNLDLIENFDIELIDYERNTTIPEISIMNKDETSISCKISYPAENGRYKLSFIVNNEKQIIKEKYYPYTEKNYYITIEGLPEFKEFRIPLCGNRASDYQVKAIILGKNFLASSTNPSNFVITSNKKSITSDSTITIIDDNTINVLITIPDEPNNYEISFSYDNNSIKNILNVKDSKSVEIGDLILSDGGFYKLNDTYNSQLYCVAVVADFNQYGAVIGVGLKQSECVWAISGTSGANLRIPDLVDSFNQLQNLEYVFNGNTIGIDNWEIVQKNDENADINNYPVFKFAESYKNIVTLPYNLSDHWYIPTQCELYNMCKNVDKINSSINYVSGTPISKDGYYWCSSDGNSNFRGDCADVKTFANKDLNCATRTYVNKVLVIHQF